jgi:branched-chain amino acid transport system ATP-binding protein
MSGGEQQMCAIGRGLMAKPKLMLIDELSFGLAPVAVDLLVGSLKQLADSGLGRVVVEQDFAVAVELAQTALVLDRGQITVLGPARELAADPAVRAAYLGAVSHHLTLIDGRTTWLM